MYFACESAPGRRVSTEELFMMRAEGPINSQETVSFQLKSFYYGSCLSGKSQSVYADLSVGLKQDMNRLNQLQGCSEEF